MSWHWDWKWLWWIIPVLLGGIWWVICLRAEARRRCLWCGARDGDQHSQSCKTEARW